MILMSRSARLLSDAKFGSRWNLGGNRVGIEPGSRLNNCITIFNFFNRCMRLIKLDACVQFAPGLVRIAFSIYFPGLVKEIRMH